MFDFIIVTDDGFDKENPLHSSGATTRLAAITADELEKTGKARVIYFHIPTDLEALHAFPIERPAVALLIRSQWPEMLEAQKSLQAKGVKVLFHLADPHVTNTDPAMAARQQLHETMLRSCDGVVATSAANADVGKNYNAHSFIAPDVLDLPVLDLKTAWPENDAPVHIASYGYGLHHPAFYNAALELQKFAHARKRPIVYHICTSDKAPLEKITHASASKIDYFDKLIQLFGDEFFSVQMHSPFAIDTFKEVMTKADIALIPAGPEEEKTGFQKKWFPKKGPVRVLQGLASGALVVAQEPTPECYSLFKDENAMISCVTVTEGIDKAFALNSQTLATILQNGQTLVDQNFSPAAIAAKYLDIFGKFIPV